VLVQRRAACGKNHYGSLNPFILPNDFERDITHVRVHPVAGRKRLPHHLSKAATLVMNAFTIDWEDNWNDIL